MTSAAVANAIETERLVLRKQTADDAPFLLDLMNDPDWLRHIGDRNVHTVEQARRCILEGAVAMYARHGCGLYLVELKDGRTPIGLCGLLKRDTLDDVDLGFALAREFRGQGYALEAATATLNYGLDVLGLRRIVAIVSPGNADSLRLLAKLGFSFEHEIDQPGGKRVLLYARLRGET